jgi:hypothetical protein
MSTESRYDGKPFVRFLDCYVLKAIGHLEPCVEVTLVSMEPKLREVFKSRGTWLEMVESQMQFPSTLPNEINRIWTEGSLRANAEGFTPDPHEFTREFVDTNFVPKPD